MGDEDLIAQALAIIENPDGWDDPVAAFDALAHRAGPDEEGTMIVLASDLIRAMEQSTRHRSPDPEP